MISGTITDASGRTLSGQTAEAFHASLAHARPLSIGLNCALGAEAMRPHVETLSQVADCHVSAHPNAGLPNAFGEYDETPEEMAATLRLRRGWPAEPGRRLLWLHARAHPRHRPGRRRIAAARPARFPGAAGRMSTPPYTRLSGLEPLVITPDLLFINVGERTNVTGSAQFRKLIKEGRYEEAVDVARQQVASGAQILDVNMDEGLIDSEAAMTRYLNLIMSEPDIARIPVMVDSSKWSVIEAGLKCRARAWSIRSR